MTQPVSSAAPVVAAQAGTKCLRSSSRAMDRRPRFGKGRPARANSNADSHPVLSGGPHHSFPGDPCRQWARAQPKTVIAISACAALLAITLLSGCGGANEQQQVDERAAVTKAQIDRVRKGMSENDVIRVLGKPFRIQPGDDRWEQSSKSLYYNVKAEDGFDQWLVAIEDGAVRSVHRE